jgi:hypothetical protein
MSMEPEYPIKERKPAGEPAVELSFSETTHFGNHDCNAGGETLLEAVDRQGKTIPFSVGSDDWVEVESGIEFKSELEYHGSRRTSRQRVRIQSSACPVTLHVIYFTEYTASDYPHVGSRSESRYSIVVGD